MIRMLSLSRLHMTHSSQNLLESCFDTESDCASSTSTCPGQEQATAGSVIAAIAEFLRDSAATEDAMSRAAHSWTCLNLPRHTRAAASPLSAGSESPCFAFSPANIASAFKQALKTVQEPLCQQTTGPPFNPLRLRSLMNCLPMLSSQKALNSPLNIIKHPQPQTGKATFGPVPRDYKNP